jgi:CPA2 family monovalent cation:H+ antiporter-2
MHEEAGLVVTLATGLGLAFLFGFLAARLRLPPLVGYLIAGVVVGPFTPGIVADASLAAQLAEVGIILLMFGVGLHFSTDDLLAVKGIAVPGAILQILFATAIGAATAHLWGWSIGAGLIFGLALSVASTVVLLRALEERNGLQTPNGRIAVGWLIVEDLAMVLTLVLVPALAGLMQGGPDGATSGSSIAALLLDMLVTIGKVVAFVAVVLLVGPRVLPPLLRQVARAGSRELFTLAVLAVALGIALGSSVLFGVSLALGAFCAGIVLAKSEYSQRAATESLPLQDAFAVLFFVSVGMLFDPSVVIREPGAVLLTLLVIVIGKSLIAFCIVMALGYPVGTALTVSASLAQIGEFSFILAGLGLSLSLMPPEGRDLILAGAILSIVLNPVIFSLVRPLAEWLDGMVGPAASERRARTLAALGDQLEHRQRIAEASAPPRSVLSAETIATIPLFARATVEARRELAMLFVPRAAVPGERIIRRGEDSNELFFIASGVVEVGRGSQRIRLGAGDFFGEMGVLTGEKRSADVTAIDFTDLLGLNRQTFLNFLERYPALRSEVEAVAEQRTRMNRSAETVPPAPASS